MMKPTLLLSLLFGMFFSVAQADLVVENKHNLLFRIENIEDFPDYSFEYSFQTFHYDYGYQPNAPEFREIEQGKNYLAGERGSSTQIFALSKSAEYDDAESEANIGGSVLMDDDDISTITQVIRITEITDGKVHYEVKGIEYAYWDGKVKMEEDKEIFGGFFDQNKWVLYALLPLLSLLTLVMLFVMRRKRPHTSSHGISPA